ncbi:MAG: hypothetical protein IJ814_07140 [Paludibacteraceae bacterium]|nr:hypothetical protein [Paludibacteraceae bacterium]
MKKLLTLCAAVLASFSLWAADITWDFSDRTAQSFTNGKSYSFTATDDATEMRYSAGSSDAIVAKDKNGNSGYLKENGTTGSATVKDIDETTNLGKTRLIRLYVTGKGQLTINCNSTKGTYKVLDGASNGAILISALDADTKSDEITVENFLWIETSTKGYITSIVWSPAAAADPTKATVKSISVDGVNMADFDAEQLSYDIVLDYGTEDIPVVAAVAGDEATLNITQATALPGSATVVCTSKDESATVTYTINFSVNATPSDDATLKALTVDGIALAGFAADATEYNVELEYDATEVPVVAAEANEAHANVVITQAAELPGSATVVVTAQDGETSITYTITFSKETLIPIIRAIHVNKNTATVKGSIGGTAYKNTQDNGKLGSNDHYFGIKLADDAKFQAGDSVVIVASLLNGGNTATLFSDKGTTAIASPVFNTVTLICTYTLTAEVDAIYLYRKDSGCNPNVASISVYRVATEPITPTAINNTNAAVKAVKHIVNGQLIIEKNGKIYNALGQTIR